MLEGWALPTLKSNFWREKNCPMLDVKNLLKPFFPMVIIGDEPWLLLVLHHD
jgi:hypothetical protein